MKENKRNKQKRLKSKITVREKIKNKFNSHNNYSLTTGMIRVIVFCWLIPYFVLSVVLFLYSESLTNSQIELSITSAMDSVAKISKRNLEFAIDDSKKISYDGVIKNSYLQYLKGDDEAAMYNEVIKYLNKTYKFSSVISNTIIMYKTPTTKEYYTYSNVAGSSYVNIFEFKRQARYAVSQVAGNLGTGTAIVYVKDHVYLVRNLVTNDYRPYAVAVMEINTNSIFESLSDMVWYEAGQIYIDNQIIKENENISKKQSAFLNDYYNKNLNNEDIDSEVEYYNEFDSREKVAHYTMMLNGQKITYVIKIDNIGILSKKSPIFLAYIIIIILLGPLLGAIIYYINHNINRPIALLLDASEQIEKGEYGYTMKPFYGNIEFSRLIDTVNDMSVSLETSFHKIFAEEVATRDANIKALQSQINPHFLNNTLEIINWKVRMSGNTDASKMIEALSTMMEATMNRTGEQFISIKEEMKYVDAYLYIIECRFGDKFKFEKEIDDSMLGTKVPRLIIQPLVENMVDHGGDKYGNRIGKLKIYKEEQELHIILENNGTLSNADKEKIDKILAETTMKSEIENIGIKNVNLRLKMLYGNNSGLDIYNKNEDITVSEIVIDLDNFDYKKVYK